MKTIIIFSKIENTILNNNFDNENHIQNIN